MFSNRKHYYKGTGFMQLHTSNFNNEKIMKISFKLKVNYDMLNTIHLIFNIL